RLGNAIGGEVHIVEFGWVGQERAQGRIAMARQIVARDTAGEQELGNDVIFEARRVAQFHVATTPAPGPAGKGAFDTADCRAGSHGSGLYHCAGRWKVDGRVFYSNMLSSWGVVLAVAADSGHNFAKPVREVITFVPGIGVAGDAHSGATVQHRSRLKRTPGAPNLRQVH